jgi:outer membrane protein assembly factor BamA
MAKMFVKSLLRFSMTRRWKNRPAASLLYVSLALFLVPSGNPGANGQQKTLRLARIEIAGLKRLTEDQVVATSGLQLGQTVDTAILDAAAKKLVDSGMFANVSYRLRSTGDQATLTFQVKEAARSLPVRFDNFMWFTDEELVLAIRRDVPFFYGMVSDAGNSAADVAKALQRLLDEKNIPGRVDHLTYSDLATGKQEHIFSVKGLSIPVCTLHFPGSEAISEQELLRYSGPLMHADYTRKDLNQFALHSLLPLYRHLGHLQAKFSEPSATPLVEASSECKNGAAVTIQVEEGPAYRWDRAEWSGNQAMTSEDLNAWLQMGSGELADGAKIDKGLHEVEKAYSRKGYLAVHISASESFDDSTSRVTYKVSVKEGPQYHMGNLIVVGLSDEDAQRLKLRWQLPPGAVFDTSYPADFMKQALRDFFPELFARAAGSVSRHVASEVKPDHGAHTVDLIVTVR